MPREPAPTSQKIPVLKPQPPVPDRSPQPQSPIDDLLLGGLLVSGPCNDLVRRYLLSRELRFLACMCATFAAKAAKLFGTIPPYRDSCRHGRHRVPQTTAQDLTARAIRAPSWYLPLAGAPYT